MGKEQVLTAIKCPHGHIDTYIVREKELIEQYGNLLGCNVCEDFYELM